jgi:hypothetical protein
MNSNPHDPVTSDSVLRALSSPEEEILRWIASLPAPEGLEERVHTALRAAPRRGRVLAWPMALRPESSWLRTAAAAAIVFVVAGGGWGVYTRVQHSQPAKVIVMPPRMPGAGGFSGAGAVRAPETLPGPTVTPPPKASPAQRKGPKKPAVHLKSAGAASGQTASHAKSGAQPTTAK